MPNGQDLWFQVRFLKPRQVKKRKTMYILITHYLCYVKYFLYFFFILLFMNIKKNGKLSIFSKNLKRLRKERGLSQYDLADMTGISQRMIGHYETHAVEPPLEKIKIIADALNVKISDLIDNDKKNYNIDITKFDMRSLKKLQDILSLPPNDRAILYRMLNKMLHKNKLEYEKVKDE